MAIATNKNVNIRVHPDYWQAGMCSSYVKEYVEMSSSQKAIFTSKFI